MCFYVSPPALNKSEIKSPCIESNSCGRKQEPSIVYEYNYTTSTGIIITVLQYGGILYRNNRVAVHARG